MDRTRRSVEPDRGLLIPSLASRGRVSARMVLLAQHSRGAASEEPMSKTKSPSPNDTRSVVKNPQTSAYTADRANRVAQGHPNIPPSADPPVTSEVGAKK